MGWPRTWFFGLLVTQASSCGFALTPVPTDDWGDFHRTTIEAISAQTTFLWSVTRLPERTGENVLQALAGDTGGAGAKTRRLGICLGRRWWVRGGSLPRRALFAGKKGTETRSWRLCVGGEGMGRVGDGHGEHAGGGQLVVFIVCGREERTWGLWSRHVGVARTRTASEQPETGPANIHRRSSRSGSLDSVLLLNSVTSHNTSTRLPCYVLPCACLHRSQSVYIDRFQFRHPALLAHTHGVAH